MSGFELRHLRYALAVADHRSFRRAAESLGIHGSALSRRVRDFEDLIGVSLFERNRNGVRLTTAGASLLREARSAIDTLERSVGEAGAVGRGKQGLLSIGCAGSFASTQMLHLLKAFKKQIVEVEFRLVEGTTAGLIRSVFDRRLDVALLKTPVNPPGLNTLPLWREEILLAVPTDHPFATLTAVTPRHLVGERLLVPYCQDWTDVHRAIQQELSAGVRVTFHECHREATVMLVAAGFGLGIVSSTATAPFAGIAFVPLKGDLPALQVTAVWSPCADSPVLTRFLGVLRQRYGNLRPPIKETVRSFEAPTGVPAVCERRDPPP